MEFRVEGSGVIGKKRDLELGATIEERKSKESLSRAEKGTSSERERERGEERELKEFRHVLATTATIQSTSMGSESSSVCATDII